MPDVAVAAVAGVSREWEMDAMRLAVFDFCFTGIHIPLVITPCSDDFKVRSKCLDAEFETNLVVSFSGCTVADSGCAFFSCNFY